MRQSTETISWKCDFCNETIEIEFGFLEIKVNEYVDEKHICKECLDKIIVKANKEYLLDEFLESLEVKK